MKRLLKKVVEFYARTSTTACWAGLIHQTKAPRCIIKK